MAGTSLCCCPRRARLVEAAHCKTLDCKKWQWPWKGAKWSALKYPGSRVTFHRFPSLSTYSSLCSARKQYNRLLFPWWFRSAGLELKSYLLINSNFPLDDAPAGPWILLAPREFSCCLGSGCGALALGNWGFTWGAEEGSQSRERRGDMIKSAERKQRRPRARMQNCKL